MERNKIFLLVRVLDLGALVSVFSRVTRLVELHEELTHMNAQAMKSSAKTKAVVDESKPPYPYRTIVSLVLLAGNFLVAAIYFHVINP